MPSSLKLNKRTIVDNLGNLQRQQRRHIETSLKPSSERTLLCPGLRASDYRPSGRGLAAARHNIGGSTRLFSTVSKSRRNVSGTKNKAIASVFAGGLVLSAAFATTGASTSAMSSKLIPANPSDVMVIRNVTPNIVTFSVPFLRFGKVAIGGRGTVVKLTSGSLAVFSPVALTPETKAKIAELGGQVKYLVALDFEHHLFLSEWKTAYPDAILIGPEGLPEKRLKANDPKVGRESFSVVFEAKNKDSIRIGGDFDADFEYEYVDAHPNKELVFFFKPDKVLIEADLMFNLPATEQYSRVPPEQQPKPGVLGKFFAGLNSTEGEAKGMKRFLWYAISRGDRSGFNKSVQRIAGWDFVTLIPCHGETIVGSGKAIFEKVFEWHLKGHK